MIWITRMLTLILGLAALLGVAFLVATAFGWDKVWEKAAGPADLGPVVFEDLRKTPKPNQALICPDGLCNEKDRDAKSPVYDLSVDELKAAFVESLAEETSLERVDDKSDPLAMRFVQRTRLLRFPDTIRVRFFALGNDSSTLALYGQSQIGQSDMGVNMQRLKRWLRRLKKHEKTTTDS